MVVDDNLRHQNDTADEINPWNDDVSNPQFPSMVVIKDSPLPNNKDLSIFPPINHENLLLFSPSSSSSSSLSLSSSSFSPSESDQSDPDSPAASAPKRPAFGAANWWLRLWALRSDACRKWKGSWGWGLAAAAMVWSLWVRARQRRRIRGLVSVVKQRDEKINRLLHQIAQLNEVLIARHKLLVSKMPN